MDAIELPDPPRPEPRPVVHEAHTVRRTDEYAWLQETDRPEVLEHLRAERAHYEAQVAHLQPLRDELGARMRARTAPVQRSAPWRRGPYVHHTRTDEGREFATHLRTDPRTGAETVLVDPAVVAPGAAHVAFAYVEPSPDGRLVAWALDTTGDEFFDLHFTDLTTGHDLPDVVTAVSYGCAWGADGATFYYTRTDDAHRTDRVLRHRLGADPQADELVLHEPDQAFDVWLEPSRDGHWVVITSMSRTSGEVHLVDAHAPLGEPRLVAPRRPGVQYTVEPLHGGWLGTGPDRLLVVTDDGEPEFRLASAPVPVPGTPGDPADWTPVPRAVRTGERLVDAAVFDAHVVLTLHADCEPLLRVLDRTRPPDAPDATRREVHAGLPCGQIDLWHPDESAASTVTVVEQNLVTPPRWVEIELATGARRVVHRTEAPEVDLTAYATERLMAPAPDGTQVPVTLARRRDVAPGTSAGVLLHGYGAYEIPAWPGYDVGALSLLDHGVVVAVAHVRGGGELGRRWWREGSMRAKQNSFTDFVAACDALVAAGWDGGHGVVPRGASAGGLLVGAAFSQAPDRWRGVVAEVPFVDVVTTMSDPDLPLTVGEWEEWGDPVRDPDDFAAMLAYSPYDNPPPSGIRPPLLATGALHDPRVLVHEPAKWVARLRATDDQDHPTEVLFRAEVGDGSHGGPSGRWARLDYEAEVLAWVLARLGAWPASSAGA